MQFLLHGGENDIGGGCGRKSAEWEGAEDEHSEKWKPGEESVHWAGGLFLQGTETAYSRGAGGATGGAEVVAALQMAH